jgi:hypothetical protein
MAKQTDATAPPAPADFPHFHVAPFEREMDLARRLYWLHYRGEHSWTNPGPKATLWDEWLVAPAVWPAVGTENLAEGLRASWRAALLGRGMDADGYVHTHQHASFAHQHGWPFPWYTQIPEGAEVGSWGWHFGDVPKGKWHKLVVREPQGWNTSGAVDRGVAEQAWQLELTQPGAAVTAPPLLILAGEQAPFLQLRWRAKGLGRAQPFLEWRREGQQDFIADQRMYFDPPGDQPDMTHTMIPVYRAPTWSGRIVGLRINFDNPAGAAVAIQALFTHYDTRHNVNNQAFVSGSCAYFNWTADLGFLRANIARMRLAMRHLMTVHGGLEHQCIVTPWVGHDGRSGQENLPDGTKRFFPGRGVGNNYWDLMPFGGRDAYATIWYYAALLKLADLEQRIAEHPPWDIPAGPLALDPIFLRQHAQQVKQTAGQMLWNARTGRFVASIDADGKAWDYGFTFLNLEAIHYGFATAEQARSILDWISGRCVVAGDTSQGADLYHWRFAPRATTRRNEEYYMHSWPTPHKIPWGGQVQDGGAVLGFEYHDLMARLQTNGPDDAWARLREVLAWFDEVQQAGGYRAYYKDSPGGATLQGGGTAGGLGMDCEFFESILVPQVMLDGFMGFRARGDGFEIAPRLPSDWPELTIDRVGLHGQELTITARRDGAISIRALGPRREPVNVYLPAGRWQAVVQDDGGAQVAREEADLGGGGAMTLPLEGGAVMTLQRR